MERTGLCRWIGSPDREDLRDGTALLRITTSKGVENLYWVFHYRGFSKLRKMGRGGEVYHIHNGCCTCPDHENRGVTCKHVKALQAALPRLGA